MILVVAIAATARAETGYDAWLRYAPLPAPIMARMGSVPTSVTLIGDSPLLRSARDEIVRSLFGARDAGHCQHCPSASTHHSVGNT